MREGSAQAWSAARPGRELGHQPVCVAPWVSLELDPSGWVYACCANQLYPLGRIGRDRLRDLWGGPRTQVLREALSRWDLTVGCGACQWHMEHGRFDTDAAVYDRYPVAGADPPGPVAMTFALSNRCNLACTMCTPELSSTLRRQRGLPPLESPYDVEFFDDLRALLPGLRYAKFLGGEPFLIPEHHRVWDLMDEVGGPARMQVTTNGTIWTERTAWLLERFAFDVTVSVDAASKDVYERIRRGASFDAVEANLERFAAACEAAGTELRLCFCLMADNADQLAPVARWAERLGAALSVNVVSDVGLALHDRPLADLEAVRTGWEAEDRRGGFGRNAAVWTEQVAELDAVLGERRRGVPPAARQPVAADAIVLQAPPADPSAAWSVADAAPPAVAQERDRLTAWSGGGEVAEVRANGAGTIVAVHPAHARLGLGEVLVGEPLASLVEVAARVDGRRAWVLGVDEGDAERTVRTILLSADRPVRGATGSVVRLVTVGARDGSVTLVAEDRIYDEGPSVAVAMPGVRS